jgi:hypothetical protein
MDKYTKYIASKEWAFKRKARIAMDGNRCRLCDEDGSRYQLEVHHRPMSYARIPNESVEDDLITVCSRCHNLVTSSIREDRYGKRELEPTIETNYVHVRLEIDHGMDRDEVQIDWISPADNAQRTACRPAQQVDEIAEADYFQEKENGRRSRRDGPN